MGRIRAFSPFCLALLPLLVAAPPWERHQADHFTIFYVGGQRALALELARQAEQARQNISADLGTAGPAHVRVYLAEGLARMHRAAPDGARVPAWAAGMAFSRHDLILLRIDSPAVRRGELHEVFTHELAHLHLDQAVDHRPVPRWFHEGFAIFQSGEWSFGRVTALASGVISGRLFSLQALSDSFPTTPPDVELAYAQSIDFVAFLLERYGQQALHRLIGLLRRGWSFENALEEACDDGLFRIEADWHAALKLRFTLLPVLTGTATLWFLATLLLVAATIRKRRSRSLALAVTSVGGADEDNLPPPPLTPTSP